MLHINLRIKFRFLFTDIYKLDQTFELPLTTIPAQVDKILLNDRGVFLRVWTDQ